MAKLLIHTCCAPCLISPYSKLIQAGHTISAFWYNPNIHPLKEYQLRRNALRDFSMREGFELIEAGDYGLETFLQNTLSNIKERCEYCYRTRLEKVAKAAAERGFDAFGSTLFYSRYQKHERMREIAQEMSAKYQVAFFYEDWRELWYEGIRLSKEQEMYRQKYCGCIFSEEERYREQIQGNRAK
ncbi:MAG: epoxyqueuosine reductase QueH [Candidatus Cloacimonetes bacterium]|nr:epoxyqueuosine reductase QueH [Candidatus Cloacimonadota bacterium]